METLAGDMGAMLGEPKKAESLLELLGYDIDSSMTYPKHHVVF